MISEYAFNAFCVFLYEVKHEFIAGSRNETDRTRFRQNPINQEFNHFPKADR
jgi:hypothetical protein